MLDFNCDQLDQTFFFSNLNTPGVYQYITQATDILDITTWYYWTLTVNFDFPPVLSPAYTTLSKTAISGMSFGFTHIKTMFSDPDDFILAVYLISTTGQNPPWIDYYPATYSIVGIAPQTNTTLTYTFNLYAYDSRGKTVIG